MNQLDFFKKFNKLNPLELSISIIGFLILTLCLLCSFFYFDNRVGSQARLTWWFGISATENGQFLFSEKDCDFFDGKWVWDETYPLYNPKNCSFIDGGFRCSENGRPDNLFTKWRWQPRRCNLPRLFYVFLFFLFCFISIYLLWFFAYYILIF